MKPRKTHCLNLFRGISNSTRVNKKSPKNETGPRYQRGHVFFLLIFQKTHGKIFVGVNVVGPSVCGF